MISPTQYPIRVAHGEASVELDREKPTIVVLEADTSTSSRTCYNVEEFP
jgi:transketolase C-terminal domain/subunit